MNNLGSMPSHVSSPILIGLFGLSEYEFRLVRSVINLTAMASGRTHSYALVDLAGGRRPDIAIVDPHNAQANAQLRALIAQGGAPAPAIVCITNTPLIEQGKHYLLRPLAPTKMLALLDQIAHALPAAVPAQASVSTQASVPTFSSVWHDTKNNSAIPSYRALIVDDSPTVRISLGIELRQMDIKSDCAATGEQGLQRLDQKMYDIIFLDIVLPGIDGYEMCKIIKHDRDTKRIPVVMLTSKSSPFDRVRGSLAGCSSYLTKPIDHSKFHAVVQKYLITPDTEYAASMNQGMVIGS